jgi:hypothetical protein
MAYLRINIDMAFKMPLAPAVQTKLNELKALVTQGKAYAEKINAGKPEEENTVRASYHICHHDEGDKPCEPEVIL